MALWLSLIEADREQGGDGSRSDATARFFKQRGRMTGFHVVVLRLFFPRCQLRETAQDKN